MSAPTRARLCGVLLLAGAATLACVDAAAGDAVRVGGTGSTLRALQTLARLFERGVAPDTVTVVPGLGSRGAKRAILSGALDIAISADPLAPGEGGQGLAAREWARSPFVFAVGRTNPIRDTTLQQLVDIYAGRTTTWPDGSRLRLVLRPRGDSDTTALKAMSPAMERAVNAAHARPGLKVAPSDQDGADALETIPGAIGTSTLALIVSERRALVPLKIDGVDPSPRAIADGRYPYVKVFHLVTRRTPAPHVERFAAFLDSPESRATLGRLGYLVP